MWAALEIIGALDLSGRVAGGVSTTVTVGGTPATVNAGVYSGSAQVPDAGVHVVPVTATSDPVANPGNQATINITVDEIDVPLGGG